MEKLKVASLFCGCGGTDVGILGDFDYQFPKPYDLEKCMDDYLEEEVEEKFYYTSEQTEALIAERKLEKLQDKTLSNTIRGGGIGSLDRHMWDAVATKPRNPD